MSETLSITDNRTGKTYELPIVHGAIRATDLAAIRTGEGDPGLLSYDPAFMNTASCTSRITFIDGDRGILRYRGYPIEQLAVGSHFLEVAWLLMHGELPSAAQLQEFEGEVAAHTCLPDNITRILDGFDAKAHPMAMLSAAVSGLSTSYPAASNLKDSAEVGRSIVRLFAKLPLIAAHAYRRTQGLPYVAPKAELGYAANFLNMMFGGNDTYKVEPVFAKALDTLFVLHADHEQNCSTSTVRTVGSSQVDPYSAVSAAINALYGPLHGGANEAVIRMLDEIGSKDQLPDFINKVKSKEAKLMGFGHRVYKSYDPRANIIKKLADEVFAVTGRNPKLDIALELERIALSEDYFVSRKLYPNVDFYSGLIYQALGFPPSMFTVLFAIGRIPGWLSQWNELIHDAEQKITRPRQIYLGAPQRDFVPMDSRVTPEMAAKA